MSRAFQIIMNGGQENPVNASTAAGIGVAIFDDSVAGAPTLEYIINVNGLDFGPFTGQAASTPALPDNVSGAHFHQAARGVNGPVRFDWKAHDGDDFTATFISGNAWRINGKWETTDTVSVAGFTASFAAVALGADADFYANIHSTAFPGGEIRGQLVCNATDGGETVNGTASGDVLYGLGGNDSVNGLAGDDTLNGGSGNDTINGQAGIDAMAGGLGDDRFFVDNAADTVSETAGQGIDRVFASVNYTLAAGQELEYLVGNAGAAGLTLTGNEFANTIVGQGGGDTQNGGGGNDLLAGGAGIDTLDGESGNDTLNGGTGADFMSGGIGDDYYLVDAAGDSATESALPGQGIDRVYASADYTLQAGSAIEYLIGNGAAGRVFNGNELDNTIYGQGGADTLSGGGGRDLIYGQGGGDTLAGGAGLDFLRAGAGANTFIYLALGDSGTNAGTRDQIQTFVHGAGGDTVDLSAIDAIPATGIDDAFDFIETTAFQGVAGQLRQTPFGPHTLLLADVNGDLVTDFSILVIGVHTFADGDFAL